VKDCIVIIPTYNEIENIEAIIREVLAQKSVEGNDFFDMMIVDDGSPDGTAQKVMELQQEFPERIHLEQRKGKLGLGTAYIHGFKIALAKGYQYICEMDADFSHRPIDLVQLYRACVEKGYDLAIGSRYSNGVTVINWPIGRVLMSYFASWYVRFITGMHIMDTTAGFKCYRDIVLKTIELDKIKFIGYAFQIEMKFMAWKYGFKITEVPIIFQDRQKGVSKMSTKIFKEAFLGVIQLKINSLFRTFHRQP
jgi:dolichol-phosphate mannosyltransferase